ncbi:MAG: hypothetical protein KME11_14235 [Timaviella obliquedivisa GSE-PSE-MK23-08B]|jgi:serine/threonine protein kinase|nr:hypothetical protein [Timaviella obliquedivisa GSE-PSE-MK23-08B]
MSRFRFLWYALKAVPSWLFGIVSQASSQLQQFVHWLESASLHIADSREFRRLGRFLRQGWFSPEQLWGAAIVVALLIWNWQLVLALAIGIVVLVVIYLAQQGQWKIPNIDWRWLWTGSHRPLTLAIASGGIAAFSAYVTTGIWLEAERSWLALGVILQGFGTLTVLLLLTWQTLNRQFETAGLREDQQLDSLLDRLSDADPLKRLIAVRQITHRLQVELTEASPASNSISPADLADCFRLMLNRETEPSVCSALLDGLQSLGQGRLNAATRQAVSVTAMRQIIEE